MHPDRITLIQHAPEENPGYLATILDGMKIPYEIVCPYETGELGIVPSSSLIILGGPMSVNDEKEYPFLAPEKNLVREWVRRGLPVLGICLGAQLIASAHGASVSPCIPELGWHSVRRSERAGLPRFPDRFTVFQMHGESFDVPDGGRLFATGQPVRNQGFLLHSACGIQFHLEMTADLVNSWTSPLERSLRERICSDTSLHMEESNRLCSLLMSWFLQNKGKNHRNGRSR
ncbi:MAG: type 1 glutamine amidotransferase [Methanolinea sp.]|nr:type 1 glutamine amidotransferase [Methanolinea sp.]